MNVLRIALKELKTFRDPKMLVFMLATPLLLMFILGTVLSNAFNSSAEINEIRLLTQLETGDSMLQESWESFVRVAEQSGFFLNKRGGAMKQPYRMYRTVATRGM